MPKIHSLGANKWRFTVCALAGGKLRTKQITVSGSRHKAELEYFEARETLRRECSLTVKAKKQWTLRQAYEYYRQDKPDAHWPIAKKLLVYCGDLILGETFDAAFGAAWKLYKESLTVFGSHPSRSATNKFLTLARVVLNHCRKFHLIQGEYLSMFSPEVERGRERYLEEFEVLKISNHLPSWAIPLIWCAYRTGCRQGELRVLRKSEVDLLHGFFTVTSRKGKEERSRMVPIPKELFNHFLDAAEMVFPCEGREAQKDSVVHAWGRACKAAGIADAHFHDLRGTAATNMALAGERQAVIDKLLGHSTRRMAERYQKVIGSIELVRAVNGQVEGKSKQLMVNVG